MLKSLDAKLSALAKDRHDHSFILADAKDADMAFGARGLGKNSNGSYRSVEDYRDQIRQIASQGLVDILLMSASTAEILVKREGIFRTSSITPAVRANDSTDIHVVRGGVYANAPSRPFNSATLDDIQRCGGAAEGEGPLVNLGLYSITLNNLADYDYASIMAFQAFRLAATAQNFQYFLEVFKPNVAPGIHGLKPEDVPVFMNDQIVRLLAGVPSYGRPRFLKIPYMGPAALEELCGYDSSVTIGIMGGSAGTTHDAFRLLHEAKKYGARAALFGRKINSSEHQPSFVEHLRRVADDQMTPIEAVKSYHQSLNNLNIRPQRSLEDDLETTEFSKGAQSYGGHSS